MWIIEKIKGLDEKKRRVVVLVVLFFLALPLLFLVGRNFKIRMAELEQDNASKLRLPEAPPEVGKSWEELQQAKEELDEQRAVLETFENFGTSTNQGTSTDWDIPADWGDFSTDTMPTTTGEVNFENDIINIPDDF